MDTGGIIRDEDARLVPGLDEGAFDISGIGPEVYGLLGRFAGHGTNSFYCFKNGST
jgi:hypothetical protein